MNKRAQKDFIKKYAQLAADNNVNGVVSRDLALGQLGMLGQLALVGLHDRQYYARVTMIAAEIRNGRPNHAQQLAGKPWVFPKVDGSKPLEGVHTNA